MEWIGGIISLAITAVVATWDWANAHWLPIFVVLILFEVKSLGSKLDRIDRRLNVMQMDDQDVKRVVANIDLKTDFRDS